MSSNIRPETDGADKTMHRRVQNHLKWYCSCHRYDWNEFLPAAGFACNLAVLENLGIHRLNLILGEYSNHNWISYPVLRFQLKLLNNLGNS